MMQCFQDSERAVSREEGMALAQEHKCSFLECSAKTRENVLQCFKELTLKVHCYRRKCPFILFLYCALNLQYVLKVNGSKSNERIES
jgi:hypothetical protein